MYRTDKDSNFIFRGKISLIYHPFPKLLHKSKTLFTWNSLCCVHFPRKQQYPISYISFILWLAPGDVIAFHSWRNRRYIWWRLLITKRLVVWIELLCKPEEYYACLWLISWVKTCNLSAEHGHWTPRNTLVPMRFAFLSTQIMDTIMILIKYGVNLVRNYVKS